MKLYVEEHVKIEQMHVMPWWVITLMIVEVLAIVAVSICACWTALECRKALLFLSGMLISVVATSVVAHKYVILAKDVYSEYLKWQTERAKGEIQNSKLSETLLKLWEHHEDCKGKSLQITMVMFDTQVGT